MERQIIQIYQDDLDKLVSQRNDALTENNELKVSVNETAEVVNFVKNEILGGSFPDEKGMNAIFYARLGKNLMSLGFSFNKDKSKFEQLIKSLKYLIEVLPKYMDETQLNKLKNGN